MRTLSVYFLLAILLVTCRNVAVDQTQVIVEQNQRMETLFNQGDMSGVAGIYHHDGHMYSGYIHLQGSEQIEAYWNEIEDPINWDLQVLEVSESYEDILANEAYKALSNKPKHWKEFGIVLDEGKTYLYQFGISQLTRIWKGEEKMSEVHFLLVWVKDDSGEWKIFIDTYS
jgi:ketosteroid isomerase-like protein